jgi:hypothetical protein
MTYAMSLIALANFQALQQCPIAKPKPAINQQH